MTAAPLTINEALRQAIVLHQTGQLQNAERVYRAILQTQPRHPDANHNLGVLAMQVKQQAIALPLFKTALDAKPDQPQYWLSYIEALVQANQHDIARQVLEQGRKRGLSGGAVDALAHKLNSRQSSDTPPPSEYERTVKEDASYEGPTPEEMNSLAILFNQKQYEKSERLARSMTERFPHHGFGWKVLGASLKVQGEKTKALGAMQKAAALLPEDVEVHNNLGATLHGQGYLLEAEASYRRALAIHPDSAVVHANLGNNLQEQNRLPEAEASQRRALAIKPDYAEAHNNLGNVLLAQGHLSEAEACYRRALAIKPDYAEAHNNLGSALRERGVLTEAEACYRRALHLKPGYAEAHGNLGGILHEHGSLADAEACYRQALELKPDDGKILNNLAILFIAQGNTVAALHLINRSLQTADAETAKRLFVDCVKRMRFTQATEAVRLNMVRAFSEQWGRSTDLARPATDLLKLDRKAIESLTQRIAPQGRQVILENQSEPDLRLMMADPLLHALLESTPICDVGLERLLTLMRQLLLDVASNASVSVVHDEHLLAFYSALARQCFINEYVFAWSDNEVRQAQALHDALITALEAGTPIPILWPLAVATYFPLCALPHADKLLSKEWPDTINAVLLQQIREPAVERKYRSTIPRLSAVEDEVSLLVQDQYEENPYPRWVKALPAGRATSINAALRRRFPLADFQQLDENREHDILIAGCGTGQQPIETAQQYLRSRVLAIDLSLTSICYAKRKTVELGLTSIEYAQADILKLGTLNRHFDLIESSGVLHHLGDPWAGWRVLLSLLRPGGFMRLGFYSETARRDIVRGRTFIEQQGYGRNADDIRRCRQALIGLDKNAGFGALLQSNDFFSISACRDLLFHVQEHRMMLKPIEAFLKENGLTFLGFEVDAQVLNAYRARFQDDPTATNLSNWDTFENENPATFVGMYQFWVQKRRP